MCIICAAMLDFIFGQMFPTCLKDSVQWPFLRVLLNLKSGPFSLPERPKNLLFRNIEICLKMRSSTA